MNMPIADGSRVTLRCCVTEASGPVLDDGSKPLVFVCGQQQVLAALEAALIGKSAGFQRRIALLPEQAYGLHRPELVFEAVRENLPPGLELAPGMDLSPSGAAGQFNLRVLALTELGALLDGNHRLAGKGLVFDIEVLDVQAVGELSHG